MKLLFDQNLSPKLVFQLSDIYPDSKHVFELGMGSSTDMEIWKFAREKGYTIVSKDSDFSDMTVLRGFPPKLIWIRRGNCNTHLVAQLLRDDIKQIIEFHKVEESGIFILY